LAKAPPGYVAPALVTKAGAAPAKAAGTLVDWAPSEIFKAWQFYALVFMFIGTTQSGLLVIANAAPIGTKILGASAWLLVSWGGLINALGRVGTGMYSDKIGRGNAYALNCLVSAACLFLLPAILGSNSVFLMFLAVGIAYWQYGGGAALMPPSRPTSSAPEPGHELRSGVHRLGSGSFHDPLAAHQRHDRHPGLLSSFRLVLIIAVVLPVTKRRCMLHPEK
jgi:MFS family permease